MAVHGSVYGALSMHINCTNLISFVLSFSGPAVILVSLPDVFFGGAVIAVFGLWRFSQPYVIIIVIAVIIIILVCHVTICVC